MRPNDILIISDEEAYRIGIDTLHVHWVIGVHTYLLALERDTQFILKST